MTHDRFVRAQGVPEAMTFSIRDARDASRYATSLNRDDLNNWKRGFDGNRADGHGSFRVRLGMRRSTRFFFGTAAREIHTPLTAVAFKRKILPLNATAAKWSSGVLSGCTKKGADS